MVNQNLRKIENPVNYHFLVVNQCSALSSGLLHQEVNWNSWIVQHSKTNKERDIFYQTRQKFHKSGLTLSRLHKAYSTRLDNLSRSTARSERTL